MRVLITGASGFLGGHIADACVCRGDQVKVIIRNTSDTSSLKAHGNKISYVHGTIEDENACLEATSGVDIVFHAAARVLEQGHRKQFIETNVEATKKLIVAARRNQVKKFVFISSPSVVAEFNNQIHINETYPYPKKPLNYYCDTKALAEQYALSQNSKEMLITSIRPRGIWGIRDKTGFVPKLLYKMQQEKLQNLANGYPVYATLCHVSNVVHACLLAANSKQVGGKAYFITDGQEVEVWSFLNDLAHLFDIPPVTKNMNTYMAKSIAMICECVWKLPYLRKNVPLPLSMYALGLLSKTSTYDISRAKRDFGYQPITHKQVGFQELKTWVAHIGGFNEFTKHVR